MHFFQAPRKIHRVELTQNTIHVTSVLDGWTSQTSNISDGAATLMMYQYDTVVMVCHIDGTVLWEMHPDKMHALSAMISDGMTWDKMTHILKCASDETAKHLFGRNGK